MIIVMKKNAPRDQIDHVLAEVEKGKLKPMPLFGTERTVIAVIGDERLVDLKHFRALLGVETVMPVLKPYRLAARDTKHDNTVVEIAKGISIGGKKIHVIAGPCSVESYEVQKQAIENAKKAGCTIQRGGAFKPRTSPYAFQGMGEEGLKIMTRVREETGAPICTEVMDPRLVELVSQYADILQIGTRNMQNYNLLKEVGKSKKPVLLKRGLSATIEELLMAAEYIMSEGNQNVILCERGIRTFEKATRNTLDISAVPVLKKLSHLPVIIDPSHAAGNRDYVAALSRAAIAAGADGILVEVHPNPESASSDADQTIGLEALEKLMKELKPIAKAIGREL
jgi:3-deoxy-7-phosphoheptulonate synthase